MACIKVFTAKEALDAVTAAVQNGTESSIIVIEKKKVAKTYKGTEFLNVYFNIGNVTKKEGWFLIENVEIPRGMADPNDANDKRNEFEGIRMQLQTNLSKCGDFGKFLQTLNPVWRKTIEDLSAKGVINTKNRKIHDLLRLNLSENNTEAPGGAIDDPSIHLQIDLGIFPAKYPHAFLRGQPKTQIYDARTKYTDEHGRVQYKLATVTNDGGVEEALTKDNVHLFVTNGSKIVKARVMMHSVPISQSWVSMPMVVNTVVIQPGEGGGFSDEFEEEPAAVNAPVAEPAHTVDTPAAVVDVPAVVAPVDIDDDAIRNVLAGM